MRSRSHNRVGSLHLCSILLVASSLVTSCATTQLWRDTDPNRELAIPQDTISEVELQRKGLAYRSDDHAGKYYVAKTPLQRFGNHTLRFFATPATVLLDVASLTPFLAVAWMDAFSQSDLVIQSGGHDHLQRRELRTPGP